MALASSNNGAEISNVAEVVGDAAEQNDAKEPVDNYLTLTGTIKRSKKSSKKTTDVQVTIKKEDLKEIEVMVGVDEGQDPPDSHHCCCSFVRSVFTFLWTVLVAPFVLVVAFIYSFYLGTIAWYNVFLLFSEDDNFFYRIAISPILILIYPIYVILCSLVLGFYASYVQITCSFNVWSKEVRDLEKGFYGWLCRRLSVEECSPYEEVILTNVRETPTKI